MAVLETVGFLGFGEVAQTLAAGFEAAGVSIVAHDVRPPSRPVGPASIRLLENSSQLAENTTLLFSCVWPGAAVEAAKSVAPYLGAHHTFVDLNSISPLTTLAIRDAIEASGAAFIKGAIMAPVLENGFRVPILIGGRGAEALARQLREVGLNIEFLGEDCRQPAMVKILRSIMLKGIIALAFETYWGAEKFGVSKEVLGSAFEALSKKPIAEIVTGWMETTLVHAERRSQEMVEVEQTLHEVGVEPLMTTATKEIFRRVASQAAEVGKSRL
jgi:3-hydroxyisobutyrate dehydrogenase-like beta-hydroxyacid dehydrogenase